MTKKHFEAAAQYVREGSFVDDHARTAVIRAFAIVFGEFNPRFNEAQFVAACRAEDYHDGRITRRYSQRGAA
jgi:hypothetical protein